MLNLASLNQRVNALTAKVNNIVPSVPQDLADTLLNGNSAGASDINMNSNDILSCDNLQVTTINGSAYPPVVPVDTLQQVLTAGNITDKQVIFRTDPLVSQLTLNTVDELLFNYENYTATGGFPGSKTTYVTDQFVKEQAFIGSLGVYNVATLEVNGDPLNAPTNLKSQVSLLEENTAIGKNVATTVRPVGITQVNTGVTPSNFTVTTDSNFLVTSDNFTVGASSIGLPTATANLTITPSSILYTNPTVPTLPFFISSQNDFTVASDNFDLSNTRLIMPSLASSSYMDFDSATGKMALVNGNAGGALAPQLTLTNTNATGSVALETYKNKPTAGIAGEPLFTHSCFGKDSANGKQEYTRITHTIRDPTNGSEEGSIEMGCFIAGTYQNMLQLNGVDTPAGEVNVLRPIDLSTGSTGLIKTSGTGSTSLTLDATPSVGLGSIELKPKTNGYVNIPSGGDPSNDYIRINPQAGANTQTLLMTANDGGGFANSINLINSQYNPIVELKADFGGAVNRTITLSANGNSSTSSLVAYDGQTQNPFTIQATNPSGNGSIELKVDDTSGDLILTGTNIESGTSGSTSGQHLRIKLNGTYYKIELKND